MSSALPAIHTQSVTARSRLTAYSLVSILLTIASATAFLSPLHLAGVSKHYDLSATATGGLITLELICSALAAVGLSAPLTRMNVARISVLASAVTLVAQVLTCAMPSIALFTALRVIAGIGSGVLYAVGCYWASQHQHGVRILSVAFIVANAVYGLALATLPRLMESHGAVYLFGFESAICIAALLQTALAGNLERHAPPVSREVATQDAGRKALFFLLVICAFGNGGLQMLWTFSEGAAAARGFDLDSTATILGVSTLFSIVGSLLAVFLDRRIGAAVPLALGMLGGAVAGGAIAAAVTLPWYAGGIFAYGLACFFSLPYQLGAGSALDSSGRAATLAGATVFLAGAVAPVIGGFIQDRVSLNAVAWTACLACLVAAASALHIRRYLNAPIE